jgi:hypothetical protein
MASIGIFRKSSRAKLMAPETVVTTMVTKRATIPLRMLKILYAYWATISRDSSKREN